MDIKIILGSFIRGMVQVAAGVLVSKGIIDAAGAEPFVEALTGVIVGGVVFLCTLAWSLISKKAALDTPVK